MANILIRNLIKRANTIQSSMDLQTIKQTAFSAITFQELISNISHLCQQTSTEVRKILDTQNKSPADLPVRTRRAYQWILYLSEDNNLLTHLDALQRVALFSPAVISRKGFREIDFSFYHQSALYKTSRSLNGVEIKVQEAFIQAPDQVISALLEITLNKPKDNSKSILREYTFTEDFQSTRTELEYLGVPKGSFSKGISQDLESSFQRVNRDYFHNRLSRPQLKWSNRFTYRKFGHYQWDIDTVMVSKTLDNPQIPKFVIDFVVFHELLHKKLGVNLVNGRRMAHTTRFRNTEKEFRQYQQAKDYLNRITKKKT